MIRNLVILFFGIIGCILGLTFYHFSSTKNIKTLALNLFHHEDKSGVENVNYIIEKAKFEKAKSIRQNFGFTGSNHWFKFHLEADSNPKSLSLEITNSKINQLELFEVNHNNINSLGISGDRYPFAKRPTPTKTFVYQIYLNSYQSADYYLKLNKRNEILSTEIKLWHTSDFEDKDQRAYFLWGIFLGLSVLVILVNSLFFYSTKDKVYLWFSIYILAMALSQMAETGLSFQYLWPNFPIFNQPEPIFQAVWFYSAAVISFQQQFFNMKNQNRFLFFYSQIIKYTFWILSFGLIFLQIFYPKIAYQISENMVRNIQIVMVALVLVISFWVFYMGFRSINKLYKLYAIGFSIQTLLQYFVAYQKLTSEKSDAVYIVDAFQFLIIVFLIDLIIFTYLLAIRYRNSIEDTTHMQLILAENAKKLGDDTINILAKERNDINEKLQNIVGGNLNKALSYLKQEVDSELNTNSRSLIYKIKQHMQSISENVIPIDLFQNGLRNKLIEIVGNLNETQNVDFSFEEIGSQIQFSANQEIQLFRIANELINNVLKHSKASNAKIVLANLERNILFMVEDNGIGFDKTKEAEGIGLKNLLERAEELNAKVEINTNKNGTSIKMIIEKQKLS